MLILQEWILESMILGKLINFHRLLGALLSQDLTANEKIDIIGNEYEIPMEKDFREDVSVMCNLSQKIKESRIEAGIEIGTANGIKIGTANGIEMGRKEMILKMYGKGYTIAQIADVAGMDEKQIEDTIKMLNCYQYKRLNMI